MGVFIALKNNFSLAESSSSGEAYLKQVLEILLHEKSAVVLKQINKAA